MGTYGAKISKAWGCRVRAIAKQRVHFGPFELDAHAGELFKHGLKLKLQGHPIQILAMLLERPGELITREEIQQKLWPSESETFVDFEHGLTTAVRELRQALGDEAETPQYIETLPRRGYRFVGEVADTEPSPVVVWSMTEAPQAEGNPQAEGSSHASEPVAIADVGNVPASLENAAQRRRLPYRPILVLVMVPALLATAALLFRFARGTPNELVVTGTRQLTHNGTLGVSSGLSAPYYGSIQTDGHRIYYTVLDANPLRYVSVNGGEETALPSPVSDWVAILHISPDGSTLLVKEVVGPNGNASSAIWLVAANGGTARKLGDIEAQDAAFAPDGKTIVVAKDRGLYLTNVQGASPVKLAEAPGQVFWLRWSPDGQRLRFSVVDEPATRSTLWELSQNGRLRQLLTDWKGAASICCGIWTTDGVNFLFRGNGQYWYVGERSLLSPAEPKLLTTSGIVALAAATSPLGKTVFVKAGIGLLETLKWDLKTNRTTAIYPELRPMRLEFSRDGQWIAYGHRTSVGYDLWRARVDGKDKRQLTVSPMRVSMWQYSPDARKIVFMARWPDHPWKIFWVSTDGGALHEVPSPVVNQADPNWSPDGQSILFGQPPEFWAESGLPRHLYLYDLRTEKTSEIPGSIGLFSPRWSPDGRYVAAMALDFQGMSRLEMATGKWHQMVTQSTNSPFWSVESTWVYFNDLANTGLWRVRVSDDRLEAVLPTPVPSGYSSGCTALGFAPDGSALLSCQDLRTDIFALDLK